MKTLIYCFSTFKTVKSLDYQEAIFDLAREKSVIRVRELPERWMPGEDEEACSGHNAGLKGMERKDDQRRIIMSFAKICY